MVIKKIITREILIFFLNNKTQVNENKKNFIK